MPIALISDFRHWHLRAAEFRELANRIMGGEAKNTMLRIAEHYDRLAKSAEEQVRSERSPTPSVGKSKPPPPRPSP